MANAHTIRKAIHRTKNQLRKQRNKYHNSRELSDKLSAKDEINRLVGKMSLLQAESNKFNGE